MNETEDRDAFRSIVEQHGRVLFGTAYLMTRDRGLAEDAVQEALLKAWQKLPSLRLNGNLKSWLVRIVINEVKQQWRKKHLLEVSLEEAKEISSGLPGIETAIIGAEERRTLREAVKMLPDNQKEILVLRYFAEFTIPEIAKATGCREGTVKSRLSRGTERLKKILSDHKKMEDQ